MHAGSLVVPDDVIKFHFPPPQDDFFDPYAKDGLNRQIPHLFPRAVDRHDFHQHHGGVQGLETKGGVLGNLGGLAKLATTSIMEILENKQEKKKVAQDTVRSEEPVVHAGCWNVETPEAVPNLELPIMNYHAQWFGEEKMGGGWSSDEDPLSGDRKHLGIAITLGSERLQQLAIENPGMELEEILLKEGEMERTVDEDGQEHVVAKKKGGQITDGPILRRSNPALI